MLRGILSLRSGWEGLRAVGFLVLAGLGLDAAGKCFERRRRRSLLASRDELPDEQIHVRYYPEAGEAKEAVLKAWHRIASVLHVEPGRLRPQDRFEDLVALPGWLRGPDWA